MCLLLALLYAVVGLPLQVLEPAFGIWFGEIFIFVGVPWVLLRLSGRDPVRSPRASFPGLWPCGLGFLAGAVNYFALVIPIQSYFQSFAPEYDASAIFRSLTPLELALTVAGAALAAPLCEEYFFRGVLQQGLTQDERPFQAMAITALIFGVFHLDLVGLPARFELGMLFGYLFYRTGSLWPGILAHAANNLISTGLYFGFKDAAELADGTADQPPDWRLLVGMTLVGTPILIALLRIAARPVAVPAEPSRPARLPPPFPRLAMPWVVAALASIALVVAIDYRGMVLNVYDQVEPVPQESKAPSPREKQLHDELDVLRREARAGRTPLEQYRKRRVEVSRELAGTGSKPEPKVLQPDTETPRARESDRPR